MKMSLLPNGFYLPFPETYAVPWTGMLYPASLAKKEEGEKKTGSASVNALPRQMNPENDHDIQYDFPPDGGSRRRYPRPEFSDQICPGRTARGPDAIEFGACLSMLGNSSSWLPFQTNQQRNMEY